MIQSFKTKNERILRQDHYVATTEKFQFILFFFPGANLNKLGVI